MANKRYNAASSLERPGEQFSTGTERLLHRGPNQIVPPTQELALFKPKYLARKTNGLSKGCLRFGFGLPEKGPFVWLYRSHLFGLGLFHLRRALPDFQADSADRCAHTRREEAGISPGPLWRGLQRWRRIKRCGRYAVIGRSSYTVRLAVILCLCAKPRTRIVESG